MNQRTLVAAAGLLLLLALLWVTGVLGRGGNRPDQAGAAPAVGSQPTAKPATDGSAVPPADSQVSRDNGAAKPVKSDAAVGPDADAWARLQSLWGPCEPVGMGDALCREPLPAKAALDDWARAKHLVLANKNWEVFEPEQWLANFREVYRRPAGSTGAIVDELLALQGNNVELVVENVLTNRDDAAELRPALSAVFDGPHLAELVIYSIGDGEALNGLLIVGRHQSGDEVTCAYHLWD